MKPTYEELIDALRMARPYVSGAYECAFPDEIENQQVLTTIDDLLERSAE